MTSAQETLVFSRDVFEALDPFYKAVIKRLVDTERAIIKEPHLER